MYRLFLFLFFISLPGISQHDTLLVSTLAIANDTERVNHLYHYGFDLRNTDPQLSYTYAKHAEKAALKSGSEKHLAKSYNLLGILFYKKGNYKTALHYHHMALQIRTRINDELGIAHSNVNLGNLYSDLKLYARAEKAYLNALHAYQELNNPLKVTDCLINIGGIKHFLKDYDAAIENYEMARKRIPLNDYDTKARCLNNLAEAYLGKNVPEKALALNEDALKMRSMTDNRYEAGDSYLNISGIYILKRDFDLAKENIDTAYVLANFYGNTDLKLRAKRQYSIYYSELKNFENAFRWMQEYITLRDSLQMEQEKMKMQYDFDENDYSLIPPPHTQNFRNSWLLILMAIIFVGVPFILIQFKR